MEEGGGWGWRRGKRRRRGGGRGSRVSQMLRGERVEDHFASLAAVVVFLPPCAVLFAHKSRTDRRRAAPAPGSATDPLGKVGAGFGIGTFTLETPNHGDGMSRC